MANKWRLTLSLFTAAPCVDPLKLFNGKRPLPSATSATNQRRATKSKTLGRRKAPAEVNLIRSAPIPIRVHHIVLM